MKDSEVNKFAYCTLLSANFQFYILTNYRTLPSFVVINANEESLSPFLHLDVSAVKSKGLGALPVGQQMPTADQTLSSAASSQAP